jgi:hypothetical protein
VGHERFSTRLGTALEIRGIFKDPASLYKQLPPGWKYRTRVLDLDLIMIPQTGIATIMPDEFFNVYDKTGPGYSNYKPCPVASLVKHAGHFQSSEEVALESTI